MGGVGCIEQLFPLLILLLLKPPLYPAKKMKIEALNVGDAFFPRVRSKRPALFNFPTAL